MKLRLLLVLLIASQALSAQTPAAAPNLPPKPGVKEVQVPFASLKPIATFRVGKTADWVLVTDNAVWIATTGPNTIQRIDPATNKVAAKVSLTAEPCSGLANGFGSIWVPLCGKKPMLARVDAVKNKITAALTIRPADPEGGIATSADSVWIVTGKNGALLRIDPATNNERQKISLPHGSYNPIFSNGLLWITGFDTGVLTPVDATTGEVLASIPVGPNPRFLTAGGGSIWTLNQGDGTLSRVDEGTRKLIATITLGIPGPGGDLAFGADSVWATVFDLPLTRVDSQTNKVLRQWVGTGGDSLRCGHDSLWLTDYHRGLLWRISRPSRQLD
jgi:virginiamycin B lyase